MKKFINFKGIFVTCVLMLTFLGLYAQNELPTVAEVTTYLTTQAALFAGIASIILVWVTKAGFGENRTVKTTTIAGVVVAAIVSVVHKYSYGTLTNVFSDIASIYALIVFGMGFVPQLIAKMFPSSEG